MGSVQFFFSFFVFLKSFYNIDIDINLAANYLSPLFQMATDAIIVLEKIKTGIKDSQKENI